MKGKPTQNTRKDDYRCNNHLDEIIKKAELYIEILRSSTGDGRNGRNELSTRLANLK